MIYGQPCSIFDEYEWPLYDGPTIVTFKSMKHTSHGHPKSTRLQNEMDVREGKSTITCGLCKEPDHNCISCQNRNQVDCNMYVFCCYVALIITLLTIY